MPQKRSCVPVGSTHGRWTTISDPYASDLSGKRRTVVDCRCKCGTVQTVRSDLLRTGKSLSCGCLQHEMLSSIAYRHGGHKTPIYHVWQSMRQRCSRESHPAFSHYGGRGISVCDAWQSFDNFRAWAASSGYAAGLAIDRQDNDKGYSPDNCRWVTPTQNNRNRRRTVFVEAFGQRKTIDEWLHVAVVDRTTVARRIKLGWGGEQALTTPPRVRPD